MFFAFVDINKINMSIALFSVDLPNISIKEIFKFLINMRLCKETQRTLELNQDGILVNVFFVHDRDQQEIARLSNFKPETGAGKQAGNKYAIK